MLQKKRLRKNLNLFSMKKQCYEIVIYRKIKTTTTIISYSIMKS